MSNDIVDALNFVASYDGAVKLRPAVAALAPDEQAAFARHIETQTDPMRVIVALAALPDHPNHAIDALLDAVVQRLWDPVLPVRQMAMTRLLGWAMQEDDRVIRRLHDWVLRTGAMGYMFAEEMLVDMCLRMALEGVPVDPDTLAHKLLGEDPREREARERQRERFTDLVRKAQNREN